MNSITINFTDCEGEVTETYVVKSLKTGTVDDVFTIAEEAENYEAGKLGIKEAKQFFTDLKVLIIEAFGNKFTYDQMNKNVEQTEIFRVFNALCGSVNKDIEKN